MIRLFRIWLFVVLFIMRFFAEFTTVPPLEPQSEPAVPVAFAATKAIHPDMPEFTFHSIVVDVDGAISVREVTIRIYDRHNLIQEICSEIAGFGYTMGSGSLEFEDFNFDGFLDMRMLVRRENRHQSHIYWLWNSEAEQFVQNEQLTEIEWQILQVLPERQMVAANVWYFMWYYITYYEYQDGLFAAVEEFSSEAIEIDGEWFRRHTRTNLETGEVISTELVRD